MNFETQRAEIDAIDSELLNLINRRARVAVEVGTLKRSAGLPFLDAGREREVLARARRNNIGPLDDDAVTRIFRRIIRESRRVEILMSEGRASGSGELCVAAPDAQAALCSAEAATHTRNNLRAPSPNLT